MRQVLASELEAGMVLRDVKLDGAVVTEVITTVTGARRILRLDYQGSPRKIAYHAGDAVLVDD